MQYFAVALSLPVSGHFVALHKHVDESLCKWTEGDRDTFFRMREQIRMLYQGGPIKIPTPRRTLDAVYDPELTPEQAVMRVQPYYIQFNSGIRKQMAYPSVNEHDVEVLRSAGRPDEPFGIRIAALVKGAQTLKLSPWAAEEIIRRGGPDLSSVDMDSLDIRCNPVLVKVVSWSTKPCVTEGEAKIVPFPAEPEVSLSRNRQGEFIREVPRTWA